MDAPTSSNRQLARQVGVSENVAAVMELYLVGERFFHPRRRGIRGTAAPADNATGA
jgi:hypothetical protein